MLQGYNQILKSVQKSQAAISIIQFMFFRNFIISCKAPLLPGSFCQENDKMHGQPSDDLSAMCHSYSRNLATGLDPNSSINGQESYRIFAALVFFTRGGGKLRACSSCTEEGD
jgi:hypothetical protein